MSARGLELSEDAAPVLSGIPPVLVPVGLTETAAEPVREMVGETMVLLAPAEGIMVAEAATLEALARRLEMAAEAEDAALEAAADAADEAEAMAEESEPDPPVRGNWPE
jgi:hypothetical protein